MQISCVVWKYIRRLYILEVVGDMPQKVERAGYGFYIEVPEGAVPPGVIVSMGVKVILTTPILLRYVNVNASIHVNYNYTQFTQ